MEWQKTQPPTIAALAVSTGWNATGFWTFSKLDGKNERITHILL